MTEIGPLIARRLYQDKVIPDGCHVMLSEVGNSRIPPLTEVPRPTPKVVTGPGGLLVSTRCPDFGTVELEIWAGDPGLDQREVVFDGLLETVVRGFDSGPATAVFFHVNAPPGSYRVRADVHRDARGYVDSARFVFLDAVGLDGETVNR